MASPIDAVNNPAASEPADPDQKQAKRVDVGANAVGPVVETRGLTKRYGSRTVVDALDMQIPAGVVAGFIGPEGGGQAAPVGVVLWFGRAKGGGGRGVH